MADVIQIRNLEVWTHIGVPEEERALRQKLHVSVLLRGKSFEAAARTDDLAQSVNYYAVSLRIHEVAAARPRKLIETLAEEIAQAILAGFAVKKVEVEIRKFILPDAEWVGVAIERKAVKRTEKRLRPVGGPLPVPKLPSAL